VNAENLDGTKTPLVVICSPPRALTVAVTAILSAASRGLNLYNNGFTPANTVSLLVPVIVAVKAGFGYLVASRGMNR
jgi:hypothetical protein